MVKTSPAGRHCASVFGTNNKYETSLGVVCRGDGRDDISNKWFYRQALSVTRLQCNRHMAGAATIHLQPTPQATQ